MIVAIAAVLIGYVFPRDRVLDPAEVFPTKLTHINYAFANIKDGRMVEGFSHDAENFRILRTLKRDNPKLKILASVGGWTWSGGFSDAALTRESRRRFITSAVAFLKRHHLDGLDIDWEYPGQKGIGNPYRPEDKQNCTALVRELRAALKHRYLLTMATQAAAVWLEHTEMDKMQVDLDYVNLMAYDQFGDWDRTTGHHAPLFTHPSNPKQTSAATSIGEYIAAGVPARKLVLGVPFYGKAWGDAEGLYQAGSRLPQRMQLSFAAIRTGLENQQGFVRYWDDVSKAPYLYNQERKIFITYEDEQSLAAKSRFVVERGLAGIMFWEHAHDPRGILQTAILEGFAR